MYWASGAIHGPHHIMKEWADKYKGKFDDGWDAYRERVFKRAKEKGWIPAERATHAAARDDAVLGQHPRGREALPAPPDGSRRRVRRARGRPGRPGRRRDRQARLRRQHADLLHLGRQRFFGRGPERHDQRAAGAERHSHHRSSSTSRRSTNSAASTCSARPRPTTSTMPAGRGPAARPTRAPSSWPRISAARATRWRSAGRRRSSPMPRRAPQFHHVQRHRPDDLRGRRHHAAARGQRRPAGSDRRRELRLHVRRPEGQGPTAHAVLRDHGQPRDLPRRLDGLRLRPAHSRGFRACRPAFASGRRTRTSGSSTTSTRTGARPTTSPPRCRRSWRR